MRLIHAIAVCALLGADLRAEEALQEVIVHPATIRLDGPGSRFSLLVDGKTATGRLIDLTASATYRSLDPGVAEVDRRGIVYARGDGRATIVVEARQRKREVTIEVRGSASSRRIHFANDVVPLFSRHGCNASGCHGKADGQNGFKLSVFGFDPAADHAALVLESRGRRLFPAAPAFSLLLRKAAGDLPHGGGARIRAGSDDFETIRAWIAAGASFDPDSGPQVEQVRIEPGERLLATGARQQLRVIARYVDGREVDVTRHARFQSNNEGLATVDENGLVSAGAVPGDVAVMASYRGEVNLFRALIPRSGVIENYQTPPSNNFIDELVFQKLRKLNVQPSGPAEDAAYLRRVYLDVIGTLPTAEEARRFLADKRADKRARLVNELLERPEFADYWALKWSDLLRVDRNALGHKNAYAYYRWIRDSLKENKPLDQFAREVVTAEGPLAEVGPANFYRVANKSGDAASTLAQVFLGVRIACAECHHHPFDRWSQTDYYGMQAFFTPVSVKNTPRGMIMQAAGKPEARNPRTGEMIQAHALSALPADTLKEGDQRLALASWMTARTNPWFARNLANRVWAHFLGRGLIEPVDDIRLTNPPTNPELLDALARHLAENKFDVRQLIRAITASQTYQLSATPNATNENDEQNYSRALLRRVDAEVLLDMICQTSGVPEKFEGMPAGYRAIQLWDSKVPHDFLRLYGRPERVSACECERNRGASVAQVLHLMNSPRIQGKLSREGGQIARIVETCKNDAALIDELYLTFYSRFPTKEERAIAHDYLGKHAGKRRQAAEDLAWSMMNTLEFIFNH
ncbi:MAG: DUF1549 domain-containing protein [Gemmataceae bacterium]